MKRKLMDYIRAESQCNYADIIDYTMELNQLGSDEYKAKYLLDLVWFIANTENMSDEDFNRQFNPNYEYYKENLPPEPPKSTLKPTKIVEGFKGGF